MKTVDISIKQQTNVIKIKVSFEKQLPKLY